MGGRARAAPPGGNHAASNTTIDRSQVVKFGATKMNATKTVTVETLINPADLMSYTSPRLSRRQYRQQLHAARRALHSSLASAGRYVGGLPAEQQSAQNLTATAVAAQRAAARQSWADRTGKPIDLETLMAQRNKDGSPVWTIADPAQLLSSENGKRHSKWTTIGGRYIAFACDLLNQYSPSGLPVLPAKARRLLTDPVIRRRAEWIGVLYQPQSWTEIKPDPAVVVQWKATGKYAALAVWGGDYDRIMEFVG